MSQLEENTQGVLLGRARRREPDASRRAIKATTPRRASLGTGFIGVGAVVVFALTATYEFVWFLGQWPIYASPLVPIGAWVALVLSVTLTLVIARRLGEFPGWLFSCFLGGLAVAVALDIWAIWDLEDVGRTATAAVTAGMALIVVVTLRRARDLITAAAALGFVLLSAMVLTSRLTPDTIGSQVTALALAVLPVIIATSIVIGFRRLVQVELDRVLVQSTVSAPRFAVGMMASEELARLDLAAEQLLDSVATGTTALPLDPRTASVAASLATELRLHLIEGRRETWLYHAITESDVLGKKVSLTDSASLAGLLDPKQRDGLLSAAWLIVSDTDKRHDSKTVALTVGPATASPDTVTGRKITIPIVLTTTGLPRNRVDPATWDAIRKVGEYSDSTQNQSLRVDIRCLVDNPADL